MFDCVEFHSEFKLIEVTRHELLTDKMCLHYFELSKIPEEVSKDDEMLLWLSVFNAKTEEELLKIQKMGVSVMEQVIEAYRHVSASDEFKEIERMRERARYNEAAALAHAKWENSIEIAKQMKMEGMDVHTISRLTKLAADEIAKIGS